MNAKRFAKRYRQGVQKLSVLASKFPERPSPEAIHDLRVAARRVQAMVRVLPKGIRRSRRTRRFKTAVTSILKSTSQVRDMDTLIETLETERNLLPEELLRSLENERSDLAAISKPPMIAFRKVKAPSLDSSQVGPKRLARRLKGEIDKQTLDVSTLLPEVAGDESKVKELHTLRIHVKKLRYVMELGEGSSSEVKRLIQWQDAIGAVHDIDVAIDYLKSSRWKAPESALADLRRRRHLMYARFLGIALRKSDKTLSRNTIFPAKHKATPTEPIR